MIKKKIIYGCDSRGDGQSAYNKYGEQAFVFETLEICPPEDLEQNEIKWLLSFDAVADGYNCSADVKVPTRGYKHTPETRARMSEAQKKANTPERSKASGETLRAYNLTLKGVPKSEAHKAKIAKSNTGKTHTEETLQKMRSRVTSEETRAKFRARRFSAESRQKMSASHIGKNMGASHPNSRPIVQKSLQGEVIAYFVTTAEACKETGIRRESIKNCLHGYSKTAKGFKWEYV